MSKISILLPDLRGGGVERIRLVLAHEFVKMGFKVEFVVMQARGELLDETRKAFSVVDLSTPRARSAMVALIRYLRERRPDALLGAMWPLTTIAPLAARISGHSCKVLVSEHGMLSAQYRDYGTFHRAMLRLSTAVGYRLADVSVGVSSGLVRDMSNLSSMKPNDFHVIFNPVPPRPEPNIEKLAAADALWGPNSSARVVTVGTMKAVKNHPLLVKAFALLNHLDVRLMFVGDGTGRNELELLAHKLGVADRVIFAGFHADPTPFYRTADLFVLSSNYEGFGNVIVEALACGTPVVSTDCPAGPGEILAGGKYGRLVPVGDDVALAQAIQASLEDPLPPDYLKARAAEFQPAKAAKAYLDLLRLS